MKELPVGIQMEYRAVSFMLDPDDVCRKLKMCDLEHFDRILPRISRNLKAILFREEFEYASIIISVS